MIESISKQSDNKYIIRSNGQGDMKTFILIHHTSFDALDIFFQTFEDAIEYALKNNITIVEYSEH